MNQGWHYKVTECDAEVDSLQSETEKWAAAGWELVSTCPKDVKGGRTDAVLLFWRQIMA